MELPRNGSSHPWPTKVRGSPTTEPSHSPLVFDSGVPQRPCLGPLLFIIYASKLFKVVVDQLPHKLINIFCETIA